MTTKKIPIKKKVANIKVMYINNNGGGFADYVNTPKGTTVEAFFKKHGKGGNAENFLIRVNRQPSPRNQVLKAGDRITVTPTKIEGA